jgi:hypothetical protein
VSERPAVSRLRLAYAKRGKVRFISHRDVARVFERAFRVGRWPLAFTEGFSPHPKVSFGLALSTGYESDAEYLDVDLRLGAEDAANPADQSSGASSDERLGALADGLGASLPEGLAVWGAAVLAPRTASLQEAVAAVEYLVEVDGLAGEEVAAACARVLASPTLVGRRRRKGREVDDDLRPAILELEVVGDDGLRLVTATRPRGARPREILAALSDEVSERRVLRTRQWIERDGSREEPLDEFGARRIPVLAGRSIVGARAS